MPLTQSTLSLKYEGHPLVIELPPEATPQTPKRGIGKLFKKAHPRSLQPILRRISGVGNVNRRLELAQILREFLGVGNTQTIDQAAMQILRMFERYRPKVILIDRARQSDTLYVFEYLAGQIPFDDIAHVKLARLAERLSRSYCFPKRHQWEPNDPGATSARDTQNSVVVQQAEEDGFRLPNLNAFYARLSAYQNPDSSPYFMVRMLRDTLEPPLTGEPRDSAHMSDVHVRSAAQYILWNGHILFNKIDAGLAFNQPSSDFVTGGGQQPHSGLTLARWVFWRRAFQTIQHNTGYQIETRSIAGRVIQLMRALESTLNFQQVMDTPVSGSPGGSNTNTPGPSNSPGHSNSPGPSNLHNHSNSPGPTNSHNHSNLPAPSNPPPLSNPTAPSNLPLYFSNPTDPSNPPDASNLD